MAHIWKNILGVFVIESGEVVDKRLFPLDPDEVAEKLSKKSEEEKELGENYEDLKIGSEGLEMFELAEKFGVFEEIGEMMDFERMVSIKYTERGIEKSKGKDKEVIEAVKALDELKSSMNNLNERLDSWSDLYVNGSGESSIDDLLEVEIEDASAAKEFAASLKCLKGMEDKLEKHIETIAVRMTPNLSGLLGSLLTARLLALAGSLEKLAKMPSSTIQVLGAEKALFRYMKGEGSAPKHGVIFLHPCVNQTPNDKRGKISRFLANKASIAARLDYYGDKDRGEELREKLEDKFEEVKG